MQCSREATILMRELAFELDMPIHAVTVALLIAAEHAEDEKHIVKYGTLACEALRKFHEE